MIFVDKIYLAKKKLWTITNEEEKEKKRAVRKYLVVIIILFLAFGINWSKPWWNSKGRHEWKNPLTFGYNIGSWLF